MSKSGDKPAAGIGGKFIRFPVPEFDTNYTAAFVQEQADQGSFSGTVLVAKDGVPIFTAAHGYASLDYQVPNQLDTKFNLGSMNKMFTAVAVAQLVEAGKLSFDDAIIDHIPDYPNQEVAQKVTRTGLPRSCFKSMMLPSVMVSLMSGA